MCPKFWVKLKKKLYEKNLFLLIKFIFVGSPAGSLKSKLDFQGKIVGGQEAEPRKY